MRYAIGVFVVDVKRFVNTFIMSTVHLEWHVSGRRFGGLLQREHQVSSRRHEGLEANHNAQCTASSEPDLRERNDKYCPVVLQTYHVQHGAAIERKRN